MLKFYKGTDYNDCTVLATALFTADVISKDMKRLQEHQRVKVIEYSSKMLL